MNFDNWYRCCILKACGADILLPWWWWSSKPLGGLYFITSHFLFLFKLKGAYIFILDSYKRYKEIFFIYSFVQIEAHVGSVNDLAFSYPNKQLCIVTCGEDRSIKVQTLLHPLLFKIKFTFFKLKNI